MDPIAFAQARLFEDLEVAELAMRSPAEWRTVAERSATLTSGRDDLAYKHIIRYDPERSLRDIAAGRRILERHIECGTGDGYCDDGGHGLDGWGCADLEDLISRWSNHPDYDQVRRS